MGGDEIFRRYLRDGKVKYWTKVFEEIIIHTKGNPSSNDWGVGFIIHDDEELLEATVKGLVRSLSRRDVSFDEQQKLVTILQNLPWSYNGLPNLFIYIVISHGVIGSEKSMPFFKEILEEIDNYKNIRNLSQEGEYDYSPLYTERQFAVKAIIKITGLKEIDFLIERFKEDPSIREVMYYEIKRINSPEITEIKEKLKELGKFDDLEYVQIPNRRYVLEDFDEAIKRYQ